MNGIVISSKQVADIVSDITAASRNQSDEIEQVNYAVAEIDESTRKNAVLVEHAALAADSLQKQARNLSQAIAFFTLSRYTDFTVWKKAPAITVASVSGDNISIANKKIGNRLYLKKAAA